MTYIISGLCGSTSALDSLIDSAKPKKKDDIFIIGNILAGGKEGIEIIKRAISSENIFCVASKNELQAVKFLPVIKNSGKNADDSIKKSMAEWLSSGGYPAAEAFMKLADDDEKESIIEYLREECTLVEELQIGEKTFILSPGGISGFTPEKSLDDYSAQELVGGDFDPTCDHFADINKIIVCGDIPDFTPDEEFDGRISKLDGVILMNHATNREPCCLRLDDMKEYYAN